MQAACMVHNNAVVVNIDGQESDTSAQPCVVPHTSVDRT